MSWNCYYDVSNIDEGPSDKGVGEYLSEKKKQVVKSNDESPRTSEPSIEKPKEVENV